MAVTAGEILHLLIKSEDYEGFPYGTMRRFRLARRLIELALARLDEPLVVYSERAFTLPRYTGDRHYVLVAEKIGGLVRCRLEHLWIEEGLVQVPEHSLGSMHKNVNPHDAKRFLLRDLRALTRNSIERQENGGRGEQWFGLISDDDGEQFLADRTEAIQSIIGYPRGPLWLEMKQSVTWDLPRRAWMAWHAYLCAKSGLVLSDPEATLATAREEEVVRALNRPLGRGWQIRKWPDEIEETPQGFTATEARAAQRIAVKAQQITWSAEQPHIPIHALKKRDGLTIQQLACHYLVSELGWATTRVRDELGFSDHRQVAKAVRQVATKLN